MGLDATVRCRCFEEGKLKPGPVPLEDLYIDEDGYLSSRKLDIAHKQYDHRRFEARFGKLNDEFHDWLDECCEHEDGKYCSEWVSNWAGVARFCSLVEEAGGESEFPLLSKLIPRGNGGIYPAEKAQKTLEELLRFIDIVTTMNEWVLQDVETKTQIWTSTSSSSFKWMIGPFDEVSMVGGKIVFNHTGKTPLMTSHFRQAPIGFPDSRGFQKMEIVCLETGDKTITFDSIGPEGFPKTEREFSVVSKEAPFLFERKYPTAERIKKLLKASLETGNPIRWC